MQQSNWTPELGLLLKELRQKAGLDIAILARRQIVSTSQIRQLEGGGDAAFYSPDIKYATGKKLLLALGHVIEKDATSASPETAADVPAESTQANLLTMMPESSLAPEASGAPKPTFFKLWMGMFVAALTSVVLAGIYIKSSYLPQESLAKEAALSTKTSSPSPSPSSATVVPEVITAAAPATLPPPAPSQIEAPPSPAAEPSVVVKTAAPTAACNWSEMLVAMQPTAPSKSAEYVHVVAPQEATVCIMDGQQQVATLTLSAGNARSIYGPAPFRVYSPDLKLLKVYFQGQLMKLPGDDVRHIQLIAASVP
jgi:transcriptional regulator with XRE-family HTH domain